MKKAKVKILRRFADWQWNRMSEEQKKAWRVEMPLFRVHEAGTEGVPGSLGLKKVRTLRDTYFSDEYKRFWRNMKKQYNLGVFRIEGENKVIFRGQ